MSTDGQIRGALIRAAESLLGQKLSQQEVDDLIRRFVHAEGTYRERAQKAIRGLTGLTDAEIHTKTAASDNTDRIMTDLKDLLDEWKPGT